MEDVKSILSNKMTLLIIMLCLVFSLQVFTLFDNGGEVKKVNYIKEEINVLKDEVDSIYKSEKALDKKIDGFNEEISQIHEAVNVNNSKIENLKKYEKIQIDSFKSYDALMWEKYFADRYSNQQSTARTE